MSAARTAFIFLLKRMVHIYTFVLKYVQLLAKFTVLICFLSYWANL
jgi:hypothetical protein